MTRSINLTDIEMKKIIEGVLPPSVVSKVSTALKPKAKRYGKAKGASTQIEAAQWLADLLEIDWDNQDDNSLIQTRPMGLSGTDLILRGEAFNRFPFDVEVKAVESLSVPATVQQAKANTKKGRNWLIYWKRKSFDEPVIIISRTAFAELIK
jgi:hypothetical protein